MNFLNGMIWGLYYNKWADNYGTSCYWKSEKGILLTTPKWVLFTWNVFNIHFKFSICMSPITRQFFGECWTKLVNAWCTKTQSDFILSSESSFIVDITWWKAVRILYSFFKKIFIDGLQASCIMHTYFNKYIFIAA